LPPGKQVAVSVVASVVRRELKAAFDDVKRALYETNRPKIDAEKIKIKKSQVVVERRRGKGRTAGDDACCFCLAEDRPMAKQN